MVCQVRTLGSWWGVNGWGRENALNGRGVGNLPPFRFAAASAPALGRPGVLQSITDKATGEAKKAPSGRPSARILALSREKTRWQTPSTGCTHRAATRAKSKGENPGFAETCERVRYCTSVQAEGTGLEPATPVKGTSFPVRLLTNSLTLRLSGPAWGEHRRRVWGLRSRPPSKAPQSATLAPLIRSMNSWLDLNLASLAVSCSMAST
jgi:hypothetical protein